MASFASENRIKSVEQWAGEALYNCTTGQQFLNDFYLQNSPLQLLNSTDSEEKKETARNLHRNLPTSRNKNGLPKNQIAAIYVKKRLRYLLVLNSDFLPNEIKTRGVRFFSA